MPTLRIGDQSVNVGDEFLSLTPEQQSATVEEIAASLPKKAPQGFLANAADFVRSIPRGILGGLSNAASAGAQAEAHAMSQPEMAAEIPSGEGVTQQFEQNVTGDLYKPRGRAGKVGAAVGEGLGNPASYVGPGGLLLKAGGAALSSAASEAAGQATEGTAYEQPSRLAAALAGGVVAGKALGPGAPKAAVPTADELKTVADQGYKAARSSGVELDPSRVSSWAARTEQELIGPEHGFTGGPQGTAPKTLGVFSTLQNLPDGAIITAGNIDTLRKGLGHIARETQPAGPGGVVKPTPDAAAATVALKRLADFTENLPEGAVVAGNAENYVRQVKTANANYAAGERTRDFDARLTKAQNATDRQVAGSLDSQIKTKAGQLLDNPKALKSLTPEEVAQLQLINSGEWKSNTLRQLGRGGAGVIPIMTQLIAAAPLATATGGASLIPQAALAASLYGARKGAEAMTKSRANMLAEMLAKRSPEYERRVSGLPPPDILPQSGAIARALLNIR